MTRVSTFVFLTTSSGFPTITFPTITTIPTITLTTSFSRHIIIARFENQKKPNKASHADHGEIVKLVKRAPHAASWTACGAAAHCWPRLAPSQLEERTRQI